MPQQYKLISIFILSTGFLSGCIGTSSNSNTNTPSSQQSINSAHVLSNNVTYDYIAPFKDYNNKIVLSVQGLASADKLTFITNFKPDTGWGNCFGYSVYNLNFDTKEDNDRYSTTISYKGNTNKLDLTQSCDIMGTNSGEAIVLHADSGQVATDPIVYSVTIDDSTQLGIKHPCADNGCKDPGNGHVNAGYYAQWAVWGRQYNPYNMPFNNINDIIYAFIGFDPATGNIKSLDASADSWGLSAVSRALLEYPYMKAHLSFGGWTNNGVNTAPMFEKLASSDTSMTNFANQAVTLMRKTGYSGIDIDWEWWSDYPNNVAPAKKMLGFYKILRSAINQASKEDGKQYTLTIAVNGGKDRILALQDKNNPNSVPDFWAQVAGLVDHLNIMNYDYNGSWSSQAYFQAMYDFQNVNGHEEVGESQGWSIKDSLAAYVANGVLAKNLIVGIPLYARTMKVSSATNGGLFQTVSGSGFGDYEDGILDYKCIINPVNDPAKGCGSDKPIADIKSLVFYNATNNVAIFNQYGVNAYQSWAYSSLSGSFVTYDDQWSAIQKTKAVESGHYGGTMFWELDGDAQNPTQSIVQSVKDEYNRAQ
ncbi:MAG: glycoside hydrolase family 18 protein [Neisseriaceae bacterium]|jgi:chitinase